jgi:AcrR family transcriptional regulator
VTPAKRSSGQEARHQQLVLAAFHQLAERGFEGLRTRDVAAEAGVNIATLHYYFPTKEALITAVLEHVMTRFRSTLEPHGSPDDQLRNHLRAVRRLLLEEPQVGVVMGELALRSARDESMAAIMRDNNSGWLTTVRALLRRAVRAGHLRPEVDSDDVAALVVATLTSMTLPTTARAPQSDLALRQLERWLGFPAESQSTD